jgi:hypothetical protein
VSSAVSPIGLALFGLWVVGLALLGRGWAFLLGCRFFCRTCCWVDSVGFVGVLWVCLWVG